MATYFRLFDVGRQFLDENGDPYAGGKLTIYNAGTSTARTTYKDNAGVTAHASPIVLDSAGRIPDGTNVWVTTGDSKINLVTSADVQVSGFPEDDVTSIGDSAATTGTEWVASGLTPTFSDADTFTLAGDQTTEFHIGRRLQITDSGGTDYATITGSSYSDPTTTIDVIVDGGGSIDSGISAVSYGLISNTNTSSPMGVVRLVSGTVSAAATLDITDLTSDYLMYELVFENLVPANDSVALWMLTSTDNGSTFDTGASDYSYQNSGIAIGAASSHTDDQNENEMLIGLGTYGTDTNESSSGVIRIHNPSAARFTQCTWHTVAASAATTFFTIAGMGVRKSAADVDAIRLLFSAGNIESMSYVLYGYRA